MSTKAAPAQDLNFGTCTEEDLDELDHALLMLRRSEEAQRARRSELGAVIRTLLDKGAERKAVARRTGMNDQTVSNIAFGRASRRVG